MMRNLMIGVVVLVVAIGALGYWRGWFTLTTAGKMDIHTDSAKFKQDRATFSKTVGDQTRAIKVRVTDLWKKAEGLSGDDKAHAEKELSELNTRHDRLEQQIKELDDSGEEKFEDIKQDLSKSLEEVEKKIDALVTKLEKGKLK